MNDAGPPPPLTSSAPGAEPSLESLTAALQKQLEAQQAEQATATTGVASSNPTPNVEPTFLGLTMGVLFAGFVASSIGIGFLVYAKSEAQPMFAIAGLALFIVPFFVTSLWPLLIVSVAIVIAPMLLKRYLYW